jgi:hypothetical protein
MNLFNVVDKVNDVLFGESVDSILADFNDKLAQLDKLIDNKLFLVESYTLRIDQLGKDRAAAEQEIVRATAVHNKISNLITTTE